MILEIARSETLVEIVTFLSGANCCGGREAADAEVGDDYAGGDSHTSHGTEEHVTRHTSHVTHVTRLTLHGTLHTSHIPHHTSHFTLHTSHVTRHTLYFTHEAGEKDGSSAARRDCVTATGRAAQVMRVTCNVQRVTCNV